MVTVQTGDRSGVTSQSDQCEAHQPSPANRHQVHVQTLVAGGHDDLLPADLHDLVRETVQQTGTRVD